MFELVSLRWTAVIAVLLSQFISQIFNSSESVIFTLSWVIVECPWAAVGQPTPDPAIRTGDIVGGMVIR